MATLVEAPPPLGASDEETAVPRAPSSAVAGARTTTSATARDGKSVRQRGRAGSLVAGGLVVAGVVAGTIAVVTRNHSPETHGALTDSGSLSIAAQLASSPRPSPLAPSAEKPAVIAPAGSDAAGAGPAIAAADAGLAVPIAAPAHHAMSHGASHTTAPQQPPQAKPPLTRFDPTAP